MTDIVELATAALAAAMGHHEPTMAGAAKAVDDISECVSLMPQLITEVTRLRMALDRVRELHTATRDYTDEYVCTGCGEYDCRTLAAIDGDV